eukprot:RCo043629
MSGDVRDDAFLKLLEKACEAERDSMPARDSPEYEGWLEKVSALASKMAVEEGMIQGTTDDGTSWVMVQPEPEFVVKTTSGSEVTKKVFINVCSSPAIKPPQPIVSADADEVQYRVPLSAGPARTDVDKEGRPCMVYDVVFNTESIGRAKKESDFQALLIALAMQQLKQKCEPDLSESYTLPKMRQKGSIPPQQIRVDRSAKLDRKLGNLNLPSTGSGPTHTPARAMPGRSLVEELPDRP